MEWKPKEELERQAWEEITRDQVPHKKAYAEKKAHESEKFVWLESHHSHLWHKKTILVQEMTADV